MGEPAHIRYIVRQVMRELEKRRNAQKEIKETQANEAEAKALDGRAQQ